jgi:hypothetical protein
MEDLFLPLLNDEEKVAYFHRRLYEKIMGFEEKEIEGKDLRDKIYREKEKLRYEVEHDIFIERIQLTPLIKKRMREHIHKNGLAVTVGSPLNVHLPETVRTHQEFVQHLCRQEGMFSLVFPDLKKFEESNPQKPKQCYLFDKNDAWIKQGPDGIYRYFSKRKNGRYAYFTLFDLMEINYGSGINPIVDLNVARRKIIDVLGVTYDEREFENSILASYNKNKALLKDKAHLKKNYPHLYKFIGKQLPILTTLHEEALLKPIDQLNTINGNAVFFDSVRNLADKMNKHYSLVNKAINLFATLNIVTKHPSKSVVQNTSLFQYALAIQKENPHFRLMNFYSLPQYDENTLQTAENIAKKLIDFKITKIDSINTKTVTKVFGMQKAVEVYDTKEISLFELSADDLYELSLIHLDSQPDLEDFSCL